MDVLRLAAREMTCRRGKTLAGVFAVILGISVVVAAQTLSKALYDHAKEELLRFGANIVVQPSGSAPALDATTAGEQQLIPESYAARARDIERIFRVNRDVKTALAPFV